MIKALLPYLTLTSIFYSQLIDSESLNDILIDIAVEHQCELVVKNSLLENIKVVGNQYRRLPLRKKLKTLLDPYNLSFSIEGHKISIYKKKHTFYGFVRNKDNSENIYNAAIRILDEDIGAVSNQHGFFSIEDINEPRFKVIASHINYISDTALIELKSEKFTKTFYLKPFVYEQQIEVTPGKINNLPVEASSKFTKVSTQQNRLLAFFMESDLLREMQKLPGVQPLIVPSAEFSIRGASPSNHLILLDGVELYSPFHLYSYFSAINPQAIREYEVFLDDVPLKSNTSLSGVVNIISKDGNKEHFQGNFQFSTLTSSLALELPILNGAAYISGRKSYRDIFNKNRKFSTFDINGNIFQDVSTNDRIRFQFYSSQDKDFFGGEDIDAFENSIYKFDWRRVVSESMFANLVISHTDYKIFYNNSENNSNRESNNVSNISLNIDFDYYKRKHKIQFGYHLKKVNYDYSIFPFDNLVIKDYKNENYFHHLYYDIESELSKNFSLSGGNSLDYSSKRGIFSLSSNIFINYKVNSSNYFAGYRKHFQHHFVHSGLRYIYGRFILDKSINSLPSLDQYSAGFIYQNNTSVLKLTTYIKKSYHLLRIKKYQSDTEFIYRKNISDILLHYNANGYGFEFLYHYKTNSFESQFSYSYLQNKYSDVKNEFERPHSVAVSLRFPFSGDWELNGELQYMSDIEEPEEYSLFKDKTPLFRNFRLSKYFDLIEVYLLYSESDFDDFLDDLDVPEFTFGFQINF